MLQFHSIHRLEQTEAALRNAASRHGGNIAAVTRVGPDALTFTVCLAGVCEPLLAADARVAALLPLRVAATARGGAVVLEALSPREFCRMIHRPELDGLAASVEDALQAIMADCSRRAATGGTEHPATEDMINMRGALPQRVDCHGTKIEELAGTGTHDAQGG